MTNGKTKASKHAKSESMWAYIMVAPTIIGLLVLNIYLFIDTIKLSFPRQDLSVFMSFAESRTM